MSQGKCLVVSLNLLLFSYLVCGSPEEIQADENTSGETWSCPKGWEAFTNDEPYECLWPSLTSATSYENADKVCKSQNSNLVTIMSEEKWNFVQGMIQRSAQKSTWMGLRKDQPSSPSVTWRTRRGEQEVLYKPYGFQPHMSYYSSRHMCVVMDSEGYWRYRSCSSDYRMFICEKHIECQPRHFGDRCEKECHCHGHTCNFLDLNVTCPFGCLPGWMGKTCEIKREKASVAYHCIHSDNSEGRVSIEIGTKGIMYRHIQAIDDKDTTYPWCNDTEIYMPEPDKFVNINIRVTDNALTEMKEGRCAGQAHQLYTLYHPEGYCISASSQLPGDDTVEQPVQRIPLANQTRSLTPISRYSFTPESREQVTGNQFEWRIVLQEWQSIFMPDDQVVVIRCNFSDAETLSRSGGAKVKGKMASTATKTKETKEEVVLEVADAATEGKLSSTFVGAPVLLKVQFGLNKGSLVKSIFPYDCEATTADGVQRLGLLDSNGCQTEGSPVQPFARTNNSNVIVTPWFPYFTFNGYSEVFFQCSFIFCYDTSCGVGCGNRTDWEKGGRYPRKDDI